MKDQNLQATIGETPLVKLCLPGGNQINILAKLEFLNPSGSIKDRMAVYMIRAAEKRGELKSGMTIIEATTGNTGIALAMLAVVKGYQMLAVMPENMSSERSQMIKAFGAKVVLTPASQGPKGAIEKRDELAQSIPHVWVPDQFGSEDNPMAYEKGLGKEILKQTGGKIDAFVAGVGTGGTLMGTARALKKVNPRVKIVAVEPTESAVLSGEKPGEHRIQGIGEGFIPKLVDLRLIDEVVKVSSGEAEAMAARLAREEGMLVGTSSGANVTGALRTVKLLGENKRVVTVMPDRGERYLSQGLFR